MSEKHTVNSRVEQRVASTMVDVENVVLENWIQFADMRRMLAKVRLLYFYVPLPYVLRLTDSCPFSLFT